MIRENKKKNGPRTDYEKRTQEFTPAKEAMRYKESKTSEKTKLRQGIALTGWSLVMDRSMFIRPKEENN